MISTDITGNAGGEASQVFSLLAVVANPAVYGEKLKALVAATEENKKFVALVAPANEILDLREQTEKDRKAAATELDSAKQAAAQIKAKATSDAAAEVAAAKKEAAALVAAAKQKNADAETIAAKASKAAEEVSSSLAALASQKAALASELAAGEKQRELYEKAKKDVASTRAALIALHKRHIEELAL